MNKLHRAIKPSAEKSASRREPRQDRALQKVDLIFEAANRLLETVEIADLTTNAIAAKAGISIGTLYQYFDDKNAILDALTNRELKGLSARMLEAMNQATVRSPEERVRSLIGAVFATFGGRRRVHRLILENALLQRRNTKLSPVIGAISRELSREGRAGPRLSSTDAFVLTHAIGGILRGIVASAYPASQRQPLEQGVIRLVMGFISNSAQGR